MAQPRTNEHLPIGLRLGHIAGPAFAAEHRHRLPSLKPCDDHLRETVLGLAIRPAAATRNGVLHTQRPDRSVLIAGPCVFVSPIRRHAMTIATLTADEPFAALPRIEHAR